MFGAGPFKAVFTGQRRTMRQRRVLGRTQSRGQGRIQQIGVGVAQHFVGRPAQETCHGLIDVHVTARGRVLHRQQLTPMRQQHRQQPAQQCRQVVGNL